MKTFLIDLILMIGISLLLGWVMMYPVVNLMVKFYE